MQKQKTGKKVNFEAVEPQYELDMQDKRKKKKVTHEEAAFLHKKMALEFVNAKKEKLGKLASLYLWLHSSYVESIMFKNNATTLKRIVSLHAQG